MELYPKLITDALEQVMYPGTKKNIIASEMLADDLLWCFHETPIPS